jgi:hypothetical protein
MSAGTAVARKRQRDGRAQLQGLCMREDVLPRAVARELHRNPDDLVAWLAGDLELIGIEEDVEAFVNARRETAERLRAANTPTRAGFGRLLIRNSEILLGEIVKAPAALRPELADHIKMQLADLKRVLALIEAGETSTPERLVEQLRAALGPGDRLLILRSNAGVSEKNNERF